MKWLIYLLKAPAVILLVLNFITAIYLTHIGELKYGMSVSITIGFILVLYIFGWFFDRYGESGSAGPY